MRVVVVGSINADLVLRVPSIPTAGVTVPAREISRLPGGKGANQAVALARLGAEVAMIGAVGDDDDGRGLLATLLSEGVDTSSVARLPGVPTGLAVVVVDDRGENAIVVVSGANASLDATSVEGPEGLAALRGADAVLLQLEIPMDVVRAAARAGREVGATVVLNAAPAVAVPDAVLGDVDVLIVNASEAEVLGGADDPAVAAASLRTRGPGMVVVTLGGEGSIVHDGVVTYVAAHHVEVLDTTGAGDCFAAAFTVALASGEGAAAAARYATAAAAIAVTRHGAQAMPTAAEVEEFLATG